MAQCITPLTIKNPKPNFDGTGTHIEVPCGKCVPCVQRRASMWAFRLLQQEKVSKTSAFITYTYDNYHLPISDNGYPTLDTRDYQLYMKRQRKKIAKEYGKDYWKENAIKYYMVGEYGGRTERPHYHAIMFNLPKNYIINDHKIEEIWQNGMVQVDQVTPASIRYVTGYLHKQLYWSNYGENDDRKREFSRISKGIGLNYLTESRIKSMKTKMNPYLTIEDGLKLPMPRYYKDKVFNEEEKRIISKKGKFYLEEKEPLSTLDKINTVYRQSKDRKKSVSKNRNKL